MKVELHYLSPHPLLKDKHVEMNFIIEADTIPQTGDTIDISGHGMVLQVTDRRYLVKRGKLEARLQLR